MLRSLLVLAIFIPGLLLALGDAFAALLMYVWFALFRPQEWLWMDVTSLRLSLVLGLVLIVRSALGGIYPTPSHPLHFGALALVGFALLAQIGAVNQDVGWQWTLYLMTLVLVCLYATRLISNTRRLVAFMVVLSVSLGFHTAKAGLASILGGGVRFGEGLGGTFPDNNGYALAGAMISFLLVGAAQTCGHTWLRRGLFAAALLSAVMVVSTFSRGGFLALGAGTLAFTLAQPRNRLRHLATVAALVAVAYAFLPLPAGYVARLQTIEVPREGTDTSIVSRTYFWGVAISMAADHPFGVGMRNFGSTFDRYDTSDGLYGQGRDVHSSYFQMLAETGFGGGLAFLLELLAALATLLRIRSRSLRALAWSAEARLHLDCAVALLATMAAFMVGGAFGSYALNDITWYGIAATAALDRLSEAVQSHAARPGPLPRAPQENAA